MRSTDTGESLEVVRINNDLDSLAAVMTRTGEAPQVLIEATYGWHWAVDALQAGGGAGPSRAPAGREGFRLPAREERRSRCQRPAADGTPPRGVDRCAGHPRAA